MIPYGLLIKIGIGLLAGFLLISGVKTAGTLWGNMWTKHDNEVKEKLADKQNLAYQTARAEEMEATLALTKEHNKELQAIYQAQDMERKQSAAVYQKELDKDITGRIEELEVDFADFERRATKATERVLKQEEKLSDWSTIQP
jgi:hypothetical protein